MSTHKGTILKFGNGLGIRLPNVPENKYNERDKITIIFNIDGSITIKKTPTDNFYVVKNNS